MKEINTDVLIVGSGLVGLVAAHCLLSLKYNVVIVDKKNFADTKSNLQDTRTVAISEGSKQFLENLSLWNALKKYAEPIKKIKVFDRSSVNKIFFENAEKDQKLGYVIENSKFSKILINKFSNKSIVKLYESEVIKIIANNKLSQTYLRNQKINSKLIIAADGKNSAVRKILGNKIYKKNYSERALVLNFFHEKSLKNTAYEIFYKTGPLAVLPMKSFNNFFQSSIIWSNKNAFVKNMVNCDKKFIANIIYEKVGKITGKIIKINSKQSFPLSAHINETFINKRLIYIGDSAHSIHPIAGQGWNLGVKDIKNLNSICKKLGSKKLEIGNDLFCKKYNELSYKNAFQLYQITDKLNSHFKIESSLYRMLSNRGFKIIEKTSSLKEEITKFAMGV